MAEKYRVPALYRANDVLSSIAENPGQYKLTDLVDICGSNKSSMFTLLYTLENLDWLRKERDGTYYLGPQLGKLSASYFKQFDLLSAFRNEAKAILNEIQETVQLAMLDDHSVLYLAKEESKSPVQVVTNPGMRLPAHTTALGKAILSTISSDEFQRLYSGYELSVATPYSISDLDRLRSNLKEARCARCASDIEESTLGFCCIASPVFDHTSQAIAAVSISVASDRWESKHTSMRSSVIRLAKSLSALAGYVGDYYNIVS